jgi:hypothetical protein
VYIDGPSGAGGHKLTANGIDGIAYNVQTDELEIIEQKGISKPDKIGLGKRPTAVTVHLRKHLDDAIEKVRRLGPLDSDIALPRRATVLHRLRQLPAALDGRGPVPPRTRVVITSAKGTGITRDLANYWRSRGVELPVEFESTAPTSRAEPAPASGSSARLGSGSPRGAAADFRGTSSRGTAHAPRGTPKPTAKPAPPGLSGSVEAPRPMRLPTARARAATSLFRFARGVVIQMLVDITLGLLVQYFERQVAEQTQARVAEAWKDKIFPKIEGVLRREMQASASGAQSARDRTYIGVRWALVTRELDEDASDVIVWATKFAVQNPGFGEIYERTEVNTADMLRLDVTPVGAQSPYWKGRLDGEAFKRERVPGATNLIRYPFRTWILVHDPAVAAMMETIRQERERFQTDLLSIEREYLKVDAYATFDESLIRIQTAVDNYALHDAGREAATFARELHRMHGASALPTVMRIATFKNKLAQTEARHSNRRLRLQPEQARLLDSQLGPR